MYVSFDVRLSIDSKSSEQQCFFSVFLLFVRFLLNKAALLITISLGPLVPKWRGALARLHVESYNR